MAMTQQRGASPRRAAGPRARPARRPRWAEGSANRRVLAAFITVGGLGLGVKAVATFKEAAVAGRFGVGDELDAFLAAYMLPAVFTNVIAGALGSAFIPAFVRVRECEGRGEAERLFSSVMVCGVLALCGAAALLALCAAPVLGLFASGFAPAKLSLARELFIIMLPALPLGGVAAVWAAVLNAEGQFALAASAPVATPLLIMAAICGGVGGGAYALALPVLAGALVECVLLGLALRRRGVSLAPRWHGGAHVVRVLRQYAPAVASAGVMNGTVLVDTAMAAALGAGSLSVLGYGNRLVGVVAGAGAVALSKAVLPQLSRMAALSDWPGLRRTVRTYTLAVLAVTIPLAAALMLWSDALVRLLFGRGAFAAESVAQVASVQRLYLLQLPFYVLAMLFVRLTSALGANHLLLWGACASFALNLILDYVLVRVLGLGGIALATSLVHAASLCYLSSASLRRLRKLEAATACA